MSARVVSVAILQLEAQNRVDFAQRWPAVLARVRAAAQDRAELILLPEATVPGYVVGFEPVDPQELAAAAQDVIAIAREHGTTVVFGGARYDGDALVNAAYVITRDGIAGYADKTLLWHFDRRWFTAGRRLEPIVTPAGTLGVLICADGRIPTITSTLVDRGAEILVMPTAWVTSGRDPAVRENLQADLMAAVRAFENGVPLVAANKVGVEARSVAYCGKSVILAADGEAIARADETSETTLRAQVAVGRPFVPRPRGSAAIARGADPEPFAAFERIAIAVKHDDALHAAAATADATVVIDPHRSPRRTSEAIVQDEAILDPAGLVDARLDGVALFVWHASIAARWVTPLARTRAAELRAYIVVLDTLARRAFAVDPDGAVVCGTFGAYELASFGFERARTERWEVAPHTDVRAGLLAVRALAADTVR